jgi:acetyl esterase/lipase
VTGTALTDPMLDDRTVVATTRTGARAWTPKDNELAWRAYLGADPGAVGVDPYAAPARREKLTGQPPTWIGVGTADLFFEECQQHASRLRSAGVPASLEIVPGAFHGFMSCALIQMWPKGLPPHGSKPRPSSSRYRTLRPFRLSGAPRSAAPASWLFDQLRTDLALIRIGDRALWRVDISAVGGYQP